MYRKLELTFLQQHAKRRDFHAKLFPFFPESTHNISNQLQLQCRLCSEARGRLRCFKSPTKRQEHAYPLGVPSQNIQLTRLDPRSLRLEIYFIDTVLILKSAGIFSDLACLMGRRERAGAGACITPGSISKIAF